jgi:mannose-6-phosphate isomerase-like protein (cupin superfamily)
MTPTATATPTAAPKYANSTAAGEPRWFFGSIVRVKASASDTNGLYSMLELDFRANAEAPLHVHHTEDEGFYVLEGSATIYVGDEVVELGPGEHAFGPHGVPHRFVIGPEGAKMIWVLTPGGFENFVHEASEPAQRLSPPPPEVLPPANIAEIVLRHGNELL